LVKSTLFVIGRIGFVGIFVAIKKADSKPSPRICAADLPDEIRPIYSKTLSLLGIAVIASSPITFFALPFFVVILASHKVFAQFGRSVTNSIELGLSVSIALPDALMRTTKRRGVLPLIPAHRHSCWWC